jgi:SAM-dependent methyltransferase
MITASLVPEAIPVPPEALRVMVGPFADDNLFRASGEQMVDEIAALCGLRSDHRVLEIGCGCGRLARALVPRLAHGRYDGFDVVAEAVTWCRGNITSHAANFRFQWADVQAGAHNPEGVVPVADFAFPYADNTFDLVIVSSVFTHMRSDGIERCASSSRADAVS